MLKLALLGVGHLGKIHLKCLQAIPAIEVTGFYDPDEKAAEKVLANYAIRRFATITEAIDASEAIDVVTPTSNHFEVAAQAIKAGKHVFIEKPLTHQLTEAATLVQLSQSQQVKVQVGHVERFNPAFLAIQNIPLQPLFIEAHRLAMFNPRGTDVSVVLDLMIHDLDLVLKMVQSPLKTLSASGVAVVSKQLDISNARLEFENGCVANLTASRISMKQMRKIRLFQKDAYLSLDLLEKKAQVIQLWNEEAIAKMNPKPMLTLDTEEGKKYISVQTPPVADTNAIQMELETFASCILQNTSPLVTIEEGYNCLALAHQIIEEIEQRSKNIPFKISS